MDGILRILMENNLPWGGKLLLSCGDAKQLPPVKGTVLWASMNICTVMEVFVFKAYVRARDENLRWLNNQCRKQLDADECSAAAAVILRECRFEDDWSTVPDIAMRIVPTKAAEMKVMDEFLAGRVTRNFAAIDEVQNGQTWDLAGPKVTKVLNGRCYEYDICRLYVNAVVRMTYNDRTCAHPFSQGQVAVIIELPDESVAFPDARLRLRLAPPGVRDIDTDNLPDAWPEVTVKPRKTPPVIVGSGLQMGRRLQFPVRYFLCSTIHRIQGDTVPLLATQLTDNEKVYRL